MRNHVLEKQKLPVGLPGRASFEAPCSSAIRLIFYGRLVARPVLAVGRICKLEVELRAAVCVLIEGGAQRDVVCVSPLLRLHVEVRFANRPRLWVDLLSEQVHFGLLVFVPNLVASRREHPPGPATGIAHLEDLPRLSQRLFLAVEHELRHQLNHLSRGEVLPGIFVEGLVELADEFLEDEAHLLVGNLVWMELRALKPIDHLVKKTRVLKPLNCVAELELLDHLSHVRGEARDVGVQVFFQRARSLLHEPLEGVSRGVVKRLPRSLLELVFQVVEFVLVLPVGLQYLVLRRLEHAINPPKYGERQNDILVPPPLEVVAEKVRGAPEEVDDFAVGFHSLRRRLCFEREKS